MMLKLTVGPKDPMRAGVEGWKLLLGALCARGCRCLVALSDAARMAWRRGAFIGELCMCERRFHHRARAFSREKKRGNKICGYLYIHVKKKRKIKT
jgi:hypothetical protein